MALRSAWRRSAHAGRLHLRSFAAADRVEFELEPILVQYGKPGAAQESTVQPFEAFECTAPELTVSTSADEVKAMLRDMVMIRKLEDRAKKAYRDEQKISGFLHLATGQEAVAVGLESGLTRADHIITAYRCHGQQLLRGDTPRAIFAELMGRATGSSKGKGGSMHYYMAKNNFWGGNGIVGAQIPIGTGLAMAELWKDRPNVAVAMFGDGASNQGQFYEAANIAKLWKIPIIYLCENNNYGMGTSIERSSGNPEIFKRGGFANIPGLRFNGMDVLCVKRAFEWARREALANGPIILEAITYRYEGHSMSDPGLSYRPKDEVKNVRKTRDPISLISDLAQEKGWMTSDEVKDLNKECTSIIRDAFIAAENDPWPEPLERFAEITVPDEPVMRAINVEDSIGYAEHFFPGKPAQQ